METKYLSVFFWSWTTHIKVENKIKIGPFLFRTGFGIFCLVTSSILVIRESKFLIVLISSYKSQGRF